MSLELLEKSQKNRGIEYHKPTLSREELQRVLECLVADQLSSGTIVEKFEKVFSSTFGVKNAISTNNLTSAYHLSLLALGVGEGDKVAISTFAPLSALDAIFLIKAEPIVVDLGKHSFHMDPAGLKNSISANSVKAIILDHAMGCIFDIHSYEISGIPVIEDISEAIGAESETIRVGKQGTISVCGLNVNQVITTGNGAMISTEDSKIANLIRSFKSGNPAVKRKNQEPKFDYNLIDYQAAIGIEQLSKIGILIERKRKIAQVYLSSVSHSNIETYFKAPLEDTFNRFTIVCPGEYEEVERYFKSIQIGTEQVASEPIHHILELPNNDFPNGERLFQRGHSIPIYPNLTKDNVQRISTAIRRIY